MKKIIIVLGVAFALIISACNNSSTNSGQQSNAVDTAKLKTGETYYQCEMDPDVISDKPGSCSKCGMDLEKKEKK